MIAMQLPDGSKREFAQPVTVADVAASIGAGLAKAALGGRVGKPGRPARIFRPWMDEKRSTGVAFSLVTFSWPRKRKLPAPRTKSAGLPI